MKTQLLVNDLVIPLNDFTQLYIGNILRGIATSLGCPEERVSINIDADGLNLFAGYSGIQIEQGFTREIVESTVKGMLSPLKGVVWIEKVIITTSE